MILCQFSPKVNAQNLDYKTFDVDYNVDSLTKSLNPQESSIYLNQLIFLEKSFLKANGKSSGSNLERIDSLIEVTSREDAKAFYHFLKGENYLIQLKPPEAFQSFTSAVKQFGINKDTTGLVMCYIKLTDLYLNDSLENYWDVDKGILYAELAQENEFINERNRLIIFLLVVLGIMFLILLWNYYFLVKTKNRLNLKIIEVERQLTNKDKYLSVIVHDLKSPLDSYQGLANTVSYLIKTKQFEKINLVSQQIDKTGANISLLFSNLRSWSKIQELSKVLVAGGNLLFDIVNDVLLEFKDFAALNNIEIVLSGEEAYYVRGDKDTLSVLFRNILDNAFKITNSGGTVHLDFKRNSNEVLSRISNTLDDTKLSGAKKVAAFLDGSSGSSFPDSNLGLYLITEYSKANDVKLKAFVEDSKFIVELNFKTK